MRRTRKIIVAAILCGMIYNIYLGRCGIQADFSAEISAASAVVMAGDGTVVYEKNADEQRLIASTTKLMTALVAIERTEPDDPVEVRAECCGIEGTSMYLAPGQILTADELIAGLLLSSGNDAAEALAVGLCGSEEAFVAEMNAKAAQLGLSRTSFVNPHGLDADGHCSTARDLARLTLACMENERFVRLDSMRECVIGDKSYVNHNKLLGLCEGCIGGKTGYTRAAGRCLASCCERGGTRFVCVTLCAPNDWNDHIQLYEAAFSCWENRVAVSPEQRFEIPVAGENAIAVASPEKELRLYLPRQEELSFVTETPRFVHAPVRKGDCAGRVVVLRGGEAAGEIRLVFTETIPS